MKRKNADNNLSKQKTHMLYTTMEPGVPKPTYSSMYSFKIFVVTDNFETQNKNNHVMTPKLRYLALHKKFGDYPPTDWLCGKFYRYLHSLKLKLLVKSVSHISRSQSQRLKTPKIYLNLCWCCFSCTIWSFCTFWPIHMYRGTLLHWEYLNMQQGINTTNQKVTSGGFEFEGKRPIHQCKLSML